mgnify:CR=1 FL=1
MIVPPRTIPRVAGAALVLGAGACGSDGPPSPAAVGQIYCASLERCAFDAFGDYYDENLEQCIEVRTSYYAREVDERDPACADAFLYLRECEEAFLQTECSRVMARERCAERRVSYDAACE